MDTYEIAKIAASDKMIRSAFEGVFAADELPNNIDTRPFCLIANTDESDKTGTHWVAIFVDKDNKGEFFDSYGREPNDKFTKYLTKNSISYIWNTKRLQGALSSACGQYCIAYLLFRSRGRSMIQFSNQFEERNYDFNDQLIVKIINDTFNVNTIVSEFDFISRYLTTNLRQICKCQSNCSYCT